MCVRRPPGGAGAGGSCRSPGARPAPRASRDDLQRVAHALAEAASPQAVGELHAAAGAAGDHHVGARGLDLRGLAGADPGRQAGVREQERAGSAAADLGRGQLDELQTGDAGDELARLPADALAARQVAGVVVGGAQAGRRSGRRQVQLAGQVLRGVERARREALRPRRPSRVARQQLRDEALERGAAGRAGGEHLLAGESPRAPPPRRAPAAWPCAGRRASAWARRSSGSQAAARRSHRRRAERRDEGAPDLGVDVGDHAARVEGDARARLRLPASPAAAATREPARRRRRSGRAGSRGSTGRFSRASGRRGTPRPSSGPAPMTRPCRRAAAAAPASSTLRPLDGGEHGAPPPAARRGGGRPPPAPPG